MYDARVPKPRKNALDDLEIETATQIDRKRRRRKYPAGGKTRIARDVRAGKRRKPPVPKNASVTEVQAMTPDDGAFRHPQGRPRKYMDIDGTLLVDWDELTWREKTLFKRQQRYNENRAKGRKHEAVIIAAVRTLDSNVGPTLMEKDIYDEDKLAAEGVLDFDEWDNEELIRGYRRNRKGRFGAPPQYIPREVQQAAFRILIARGDRTLRGAYVQAIEQLVSLAQNADSEKVRLEAIKEVMNRIVGKVPDTLLIAHEQPWEGILIDSVVPISEVPPLEMEVDDDGVARLPYLSLPTGDADPVGAPLSAGDGAELPEGLAADPEVVATPSPDTSVEASAAKPSAKATVKGQKSVPRAKRRKPAASKKVT